MERRKFFKSIGLLGLAAALPKFLLGSKKPNQIEAGNFSKKCTSDDDLVLKNYVLAGNAIDNIEYKYHSLIHKEENGDVHLYVTNNVDFPKHYIQKLGEQDFKFVETIPPQEVIEYPELPVGFLDSANFGKPVRFYGEKLTEEQLEAFRVFNRKDIC